MGKPGLTYGGSWRCKTQITCQVSGNLNQRANHFAPRIVRSRTYTAWGLYTATWRPGTASLPWSPWTPSGVRPTGRPSGPVTLVVVFFVPSRLPASPPRHHLHQIANLAPVSQAARIPGPQVRPFPHCGRFGTRIAEFGPLCAFSHSIWCILSRNLSVCCIEGAAGEVWALCICTSLNGGSGNGRRIGTWRIGGGVRVSE